MSAYPGRSGLLVLLAATLAVAGMAGFSGIAGAAVHHVQVTNFQFIPASLNIQTGDTVQFNWAAGTHTVTNGTGAADPNVGSMFDVASTSGSPTYNHVFTSAGVVPYFCRPHEFANMKGTITVEDPAPAPNTYTVLVSDFDFTPRDLTIRVGDTVEWRWVEGFHTTTNGASSDPGDNPGSLWDAPIDPGNPTFSFQFNSVGSFPYFCTPHELIDMKGTITVQSDVTGVGDVKGAGILRVTPFPNPFSSAVAVSFSLERAGEVSVEVYDLMGHRVRVLAGGELAAGDHRVRWDGHDAAGRPAPTGIYFVRVASGERAVAEKVFKAR